MKALIQFCLSRPVSVSAFYLLLLALASVAFFRLPVSLLPDIQYPSLAVWTAYPDVPPERVERAVTERVEEAVAGTKGLLNITSRSQLGGSIVRLDFGWNENLDLALLDVREELDRMGGILPEEAERPTLLRIDPNDRPIMLVALKQEANTLPFAGNGIDATTQQLIELKQVGKEVIARRLEQLEDVSRVRVTGGFEKRIDVIVSPEKLGTYRIGIDQIATALQSTNVAFPGGVIRRGPFRYSVEISGEFESLQDIQKTLVSQSGDVPIRVSDIAMVQESIEDRRGLIRLDGVETLLLLIERKPDANTVQASKEVRETLQTLMQELPGIELDVVVDESVFIQEAISGVTQAVWFGSILAILILLLFLRKARILLAIAVAVPLSLAITFLFFEVFEVSFNLISLSGLALGVGLLVDNAIVVVENISRLREQGHSAFDAAKQGTIEVAGAITTSTLTTIAVFLPITLVEGLAGRLFRDQSLAVVGSLLASLLVALTVVSLILSRDKKPINSTKHKESTWMQRYERALLWCLSNKSWVLIGAFLFLLITGTIGWNLAREVVPKAEQGRIIASLTFPPESDLTYVDFQSKVLETQLQESSFITRILTDLGERDEARLDLDPRPPYQGDLVLLLDEGVSSKETIKALQGIEVHTEMQIEVKPVKTQLDELLTSDEAALFIDITGEDRRDTEPVLESLLDKLQENNTLINVRKANAFEVPAYSLKFNRENQMRFGVSTSLLLDYLEAMARGKRATEFRTINESIPIVVKAVDIPSIEALLEEQVPTRKGLLPMKEFVFFEPVTLPAKLFRTDQAPIERIYADIAPQADLASALKSIQNVFDETLPTNIRGIVRGSNEAFDAGLKAVAWSLLLSVLLVYLLLTAQFESLLQPLVILLAVPLATGGVALVLWLTGQSLNLMSLTGCVVLVGIVVNDAIIKVDFINQRRKQGIALREAVLEAGHDRVRPILMTTFTTVLGMLPLALGFGQGAELRAPLAIAIVGGLLSATFLTLLVVPVCYEWLEGRRVKS